MRIQTESYTDLPAAHALEVVQEHNLCIVWVKASHHLAELLLILQEFHPVAGLVGCFAEVHVAVLAFKPALLVALRAFVADAGTYP